MGVRSLWKLAKGAEKMTSASNKTLAVDTSIWISQLRRVNDQKLVTMLTKRILRLLYDGIVPVFVFDGSNPAQKAEEVRRRSKIREERAARRLQRSVRKRKKTIEELLEENRKIPTNEEIAKGVRDKYKWDIFCDDEEMEFSSEEESYSNESSSTNSSTSTAKDIDNLKTKTSKLQCLIELRKKRKKSLPFDDKTLESFSESQIKNALKRNTVMSLIKELGGETRIIKSDPRRSIKYNKPAEEKIERSEKEILDEIIQLSKDFGEESSEDSWNEVVTVAPKTYKSKYAENIEVRKFMQSNDTYPNDDPSGESSNESTEEIRKALNESRKSQAQILQRYHGRESDVKKKIKKLISLMGLQSIDSPFEADSQCARLYADKAVDGVISEDSDFLVYGVPTYRNVFKKNKDVQLYTKESLFCTTGWNQIDLIKLAYLLGCDYSPGIPGVGPKKAAKIIDTVTEDDIEDLKKIFLSPVGHPLIVEKPKSISKKALMAFFSENKVDRDACRELIFYIENCSHISVR